MKLARNLWVVFGKQSWRMQTILIVAMCNQQKACAKNYY
uniref:GH28095p n=1 Tax=Drosophila melanogaster TaxID=7227 RepID=Q95SG1_DROME|nr:GH28095p [Drosophila melanogaster]